MEFRQALITSIRQNPNVLCNVAVVILEKLKIMFTAIGKGGGHNFGGLLVSNQLRFLRVSPLLAAVMPILAFF